MLWKGLKYYTLVVIFTLSKKQLVEFLLRIVLLTFLCLFNLLANLIGSMWLQRFQLTTQKIGGKSLHFHTSESFNPKVEFGEFIWQVIEDLSALI